MSTAKISAPIDGEKLYQKRARAALPLLVRQARAGMPIFYSDLAAELDMSNPRNLNYVLGSIGQSMELLTKSWKAKVPPIQCLVVNRATGLPGEGIGWFLVKKDEFKTLPLRQKRVIVNAELQHIFAYPKWAEVLKALALREVGADYSKSVIAASGGFGGGEGPEHLALKQFVANHPEIVGLSAKVLCGITEDALPSGDFLDVSFRSKKVWVAAEVKASISSRNDILRGLFQCVKYRAVMEAVQVVTERPQNSRAVLVLEGALPKDFVGIKNLLGIEVIEGVVPKNG